MFQPVQLPPPTTAGTGPAEVSELLMTLHQIVVMILIQLAADLGDALRQGVSFFRVGILLVP